MNLSFITNETDRYRAKVQIAEEAYKEAIRTNKEFSELKKVYKKYKQAEKELGLVIVKKIPDQMHISFR